MARRISVKNFSNSLYFDGSGDDQAVDLTNGIFDSDSQGAVEAWVRSDIDSGDAEAIFGAADNGAPTGIEFQFRSVSDSIEVRIVNNAVPNNIIEGTTGPIVKNRWYHVVFQSDGSTWTIYVNGVIVSTTVTSGANNGNWFADAISNTGLYSFGLYRFFSGVTAGWTGEVATMRYYNSSLSESEIKGLYHDGVVPTAKLQGEWLFTDAEGTTLTDSSGNGYNGTITGATWSSQVPSVQRSSVSDVTNSLQFDGTNDYVSLGDNLSKDKDDAFSVSAWIKPYTKSGALSIIRKNTPDSASRGWMMRLNDGLIDVFLTNDGPTGNYLNARGTVILTPYLWYHVVFTYDGSEDVSGVTLYLNGYKTPDTDNTNNLSGTTLNTSDLRIGARSDDTQFFDGLITDVRVHNVELTAAQIADLYFHDVAVNVEAYWPIDEGTGSTVNDSIGAVDGTITSATWTTDVPLKRRKTVLDIPYSLKTQDVTGEYIDVSTTYDTSNDWTIFMWMKWQEETAADQVVLSFLGASARVPLWLDLSEGWAWSSNGTNTVTGTSRDLELDKWTRVAVSFDSGSGDVSIYQDGVIASILSSVGMESNTGGVRFMAHHASSGITPFVGLSTGFAMVEKTATAEEIANEFYTGILPGTVNFNIIPSEGAGASLTDSGPNGYSVTINGAGVTWESNSPARRRGSVQNFANSILFDKSNDNINCDGSELTNGAGTNQYSFEVWFKTTNIPAAVGTMYGEGSSSTIVPLYTVSMDSSGQVGISSRNDSSYTLNSFGSINRADGLWHQLVHVRDGNTFTTYVDGQIEVTATDATFSADDVTVDQSTIGALRRTDEVNNFGGFLSRIRCWSTNLSSAEIQNLYYDGIVPQTASLVREFLFTDGTGTTLTDTGSAGIDGTIEGGPVWSSTEVPSGSRVDI